MTPQERLEIRQAADEFEASEPTLPEDFTTVIPREGLLWLTKGGLHVNDIQKCGFGWSDALRRVILPVWNSNGTLIAVQARDTGTAKGPKYLSQVWSGPRPVFKAVLSGGGGDIQYGRSVRAVHPTLGRVLVLTEDILSACRVAKVNDAWALLGTNLMPAVINQIAGSHYTDIAVWMDDDEAGINARRKMLKQLNAVGIHARGVLSDRDPKHHTLEEMRSLVCRNGNTTGSAEH